LPCPFPAKKRHGDTLRFACESVALAPWGAQGKLRRGSIPISGNHQPRPCALGLRATVGRDGEKIGEGGVADMGRDEIEILRERVGCSILLAQQGFTIDLKEAPAVRSNSDAMPRSSSSFMTTGAGSMHVRTPREMCLPLQATCSVRGFSEALTADGDLVAVESTALVWIKPTPARKHSASIADRWEGRHRPRPGSASWAYLTQHRAIPAQVIAAAIACDILREGPCGSMWAKHDEGCGSVIGWEERGSEWRGFSTGGTKAAIDALSLAVVEQVRRDTVYVRANQQSDLHTRPSVDKAQRPVRPRY
jgi:hypothetical protein